MAIDLHKQGRVLNGGALRQSRTTNVYLRLLLKIKYFQTQQIPIIIEQNCQNVKDFSKIVVSTATVTNDARLLTVPKMTVCALRFTETARKRILAAGGQVLTFDQLALKAPTGTNCHLLRAPKEREAYRHWGLAPGQKGSKSAPYVRSEGRKFERAHGLR
ncbi:hypothetical protein IMG5_178620 [Ichthyophthirius multifiliis]|uniref:Large ribosomal subunit protein uL15/eL18 domain-containing protein n=1 Tax=Ichthyophthirius multifiliis TaxID=5932 RepID=G0R2I8_ICHMU|nr:hypothetical protein IMG5_178620 [Ichthyophthirius multifiliis]EGR28314.1 hypothetical protein IMG5_178620 [Ichthyophthirius multifiliis]|eukprot:XP_004027659.1 hypothetical protein IMG5_178620 [Ichthyophthirius multifiliis]